MGQTIIHQINVLHNKHMLSEKVPAVLRLSQ